MTLAYLILANILGLYSHYFNRWRQGRTGSTFVEYMICDWPSTLNSVIVSVMSSVGIFMSLPDDLNNKLLIGAIYAAYMSGFMFDSVLNKDTKPTLLTLPTTQNNEKTDAIDDILDSDSKL
jgi:hypothetical protein